MKKLIASGLAALTLTLAAGCGSDQSLDTGRYSDRYTISEYRIAVDAWNSLTSAEQADTCDVFWSTPDNEIAAYLDDFGSGWASVDVFWKEC